MINLNSVVLEVNRTCNIRCDHCLRGEPERKYLDYIKFYNWIKDQDIYINGLSIGGGEPSIALNALDNVLDTLSHLRLDIGSLWVVTNGLKNTMKLAKWVDRCRRYIDLVILAFSFDHFHDHSIGGMDLQDYREFNYREVKERYDFEVIKHTTERTYMDSENILVSGRAEYYGMGNRKPELEELQLDHRDDKYCSISDGDIYFTVDGLLFSNCNLSYEEMAKGPDSPYYIGKWDECLLEAIEQYNLKLCELCV